MDQFVKHTLKCRYYLRYCDDFVLLSQDPQQLSVWREQLGQFLAERLQLELNNKREKLRPVSDGIDFLGYIVRRDYWDADNESELGEQLFIVSLTFGAERLFEFRHKKI